MADMASWLFDLEELWRIGYWLQPAGIISAVAAAVPGLLDYLYVIPPQSSAKKRGAKHGLINTAVVILFSVSWILRPETTTSFLIVAIDTGGFVLLTVAGWLGGTLVYRNQIGVDHRYAYAGKWKEEYFQESGSPIAVADDGELKTNQMKLLHIGKKRIVLARTENGFAAFDDRCSHRGGGLSDGSITCGVVQCPWHGSQFDVSSGEVKAGPAKERIKVYAVRVENGKVFVTL